MFCARSPDATAQRLDKPQAPLSDLELFLTELNARPTSSTLSGISQRNSLGTETYSSKVPFSKISKGPVNITVEPSGKAASMPPSTRPVPPFPRTRGAVVTEERSPSRIVGQWGYPNRRDANQDTYFCCRRLGQVD